MRKSECTICRVAYDMGFNHCREKSCFELVIKEHPSLRRTKVMPDIKPVKTYKKIDPAYSRLQAIISRAKKKDIECGLTIEDIKQLINGECAYCGSLERIEIDRKDSNAGYTKDNVAPACHRCNTIKNNVVTYEEMQEISNLLGWRNV